MQALDKPSIYKFIALLRDLGEFTQASVCEGTGKSQSAISRAFKDAREAGLIERVNEKLIGDDGRASHALYRWRGK